MIEDLADFKLHKVGVDGCTLPNPLMPIKKFAGLLANFADFKKLGELSDIAEKIYNSCVSEPEYAGG